MKPLIDIFLVAVVVIFIIDLSGFTDTLLDFLSHYQGKKVQELKPFTCSLCMVWWTCLIYSLIAGTFSIPVLAYIALLALLSRPIGQMLIALREGILKLVNLLMDLL